MILLIQYRTDVSGPHEVKCFYDSLGVPYNYINIINSLRSGVSQEDLRKAVRGAKAVVIGGWAESSYNDTDPRSQRLHKQVHNQMLPIIKEEIVDKDKPTVGICFGHQLLCDVLGSKIVRDEKQAESGIVNVTLTEEGYNDVLMAGMERSFPAISAHKDSIDSLPRGAVQLASTDDCDVAAIRFKNNIYGFMFHPEITYEELMYRIAFYPEYRKNKGGGFEETEIHTQRILQKFVTEYVGRVDVE